MNKRICKKIRKRKNQEEERRLQEMVNCSYKEKLKFYSKKGKKLWASKLSPEKIREELQYLQKRLQL